MEIFLAITINIITLIFLMSAHSKILCLENEMRLDYPDTYRKAKENIEKRLKPSISMLKKCNADIREIAYRLGIKLTEVSVTEVNSDDVFKVGELHPICVHLNAHLQDFKYFDFRPKLENK
jgi:hypothetical protein